MNGRLLTLSHFREIHAINYYGRKNRRIAWNKPERGDVFGIDIRRERRGFEADDPDRVIC